jgi:DNA-binding transcriptional MerR regulator
MYTIGEFSKITGLTIKTLRYYHEEELLVPTHIDPQTNYRYYAENLVETAHSITFLRELEFPISEIKGLLLQKNDSEQLLDVIEKQKSVLQERLRKTKKLIQRIEQYVIEERSYLTMRPTDFEIEEKVIPPTLIAGVRMKGHYNECCKGFSKIARSFARYFNGKPLMLQYDGEYREDADFEACMPISQQKQVPGIDVRELPECRAVTLVHKGPYEQLGRSYARVLKYMHDKGLKMQIPTREIYVKGPGMIFKGNPNNYLTEIQIPVQI